MTIFIFLMKSKTMKKIILWLVTFFVWIFWVSANSQIFTSSPAFISSQMNNGWWLFLNKSANIYQLNWTSTGSVIDFNPSYNNWWQNIFKIVDSDIEYYINVKFQFSSWYSMQYHFYIFDTITWNYSTYLIKNTNYTTSNLDFKFIKINWKLYFYNYLDNTYFYFDNNLSYQSTSLDFSSSPLVFDNSVNSVKNYSYISTSDNSIVSLDNNIITQTTFSDVNWIYSKQISSPYTLTSFSGSINSHNISLFNNNLYLSFLDVSNSQLFTSKIDLQNFPTETIEQDKYYTFPASYISYSDFTSINPSYNYFWINQIYLNNNLYYNQNNTSDYYTTAFTQQSLNSWNSWNSWNQTCETRYLDYPYDASSAYDWTQTITSSWTTEPDPFFEYSPSDNNTVIKYQWRQIEDYSWFWDQWFWDFPEWLSTSFTGAFKFDSLESPLSWEPVLRIESPYPIDYLKIDWEWRTMTLTDCKQWPIWEIEYNTRYVLPSTNCIQVSWEKSLIYFNRINKLDFWERKQSTQETQVCYDSETQEVTLDWNQYDWTIDDLVDNSVSQEDWIPISTINPNFTNLFTLDALRDSANGLDTAFSGSLSTLSGALWKLPIPDILDEYRSECKMFDTDGSFKYYSNGSWFNLSVKIDNTGTIWDKIFWLPQKFIDLITNPINNFVSIFRTFWTIDDNTEICFLGIVQKVEYQTIFWWQFSNPDDVEIFAPLEKYQMKKWDLTFLDYFVMLLYWLFLLIIAIVALKPNH